MAEYSISPAGEKFPIPPKSQYASELRRLEALAAAAREEGKEVVVVMGVGFVGAVMAAIIADTTDKKTGNHSHQERSAQHGHTSNSSPPSPARRQEASPPSSSVRPPHDLSMGSGLEGHA